MVATTEGFLEVAIESWPEWDLNPRQLNLIHIELTSSMKMIIMKAGKEVLLILSLQRVTGICARSILILRSITTR